ncbi:MAG TPA: hypothetical protein VFJ77_05730 [Gaiellaceae bacterium]|nr:hypothetical protein [Gaiellaceae bacterium]
METVDIITEEQLDEEQLAQDADRPCTAELAECTCPDFCERDHANE